jgi:signal transduction histidine kinase
MKRPTLLEKRHYRFLLIVFALLYLTGFLFINYNAKSRVDSHLTRALETTNVEYKLIYNIYKKSSKLIFKEYVNDPLALNIIQGINETNKDSLRKELFNLMRQPYNVAKSLGVRQLHFHLKNNESFLRMHKPEKFGDDLSEYRYSVKRVNETGKAISGFEQGRVAHGFRFVYPLKSKDGQGLGSVEVSIDTNGFEDMFQNTLYAEAYFLLDKETSLRKLFIDEVNKRYQESLDSSQYLQTKIDEHDANLKEYIKENLASYRESLAADFQTRKAFAKEIKVADEYYSKVFIPIHRIEDQKIIAYFVSSSRSDFLSNTHKDERNILVALFFFILLIVYGLHKNITYSNSLKEKIKEKTDELEASEQMIIESKKMASLGALVAGVAHEINTPVGLSITAMSHFMERTKTLKLHYEKEEMDQEEFENYLSKTDSILKLIFTNLVKAANLIKDFKQLSVNDNHEEKKVVRLKKHIESVVSTLKEHIQKKNIKINLDIDDDIEIFAYADALSVVMTNLIINSVVHAFDDETDALISVKVTKNFKNIVIIYEDNGKGMSEEQVQNVYEPFYTTNRGGGGSGLGMHIMYNLIAQKLEGSINLQSRIGGGVKYVITLND